MPVLTNLSFRFQGANADFADFFSLLAQIVKCSGIPGGQTGEFFQLHPSGRSDEAGRMDKMGGFVHAAPERFRTEVGGVRFQHDAVFRTPARRFRHDGSVFEGSHPREGDHAVQPVKDARCLCGVPDEAVEDGPDAARMVSGNCQGVFKTPGAFSVPGMENNVQSQARGQFKVFFQEFLLGGGGSPPFPSLPGQGGSSPGRVSPMAARGTVSAAAVSFSAQFSGAPCASSG